MAALLDTELNNIGLKNSTNMLLIETAWTSTEPMPISVIMGKKRKFSFEI